MWQYVCSQLWHPHPGSDREYRCTGIWGGQYIFSCVVYANTEDRSLSTCVLSPLNLTPSDFTSALPRSFLVAGNDARCIRLCWMPTVTFVVLERSFLPNDS